MREYEEIKYSVYNALGVGEKNAVSRRKLCKSVGCNDRVVRKAIEDLRRDRVIITDDNGTGYYIPTSDNAGRARASYRVARQEKRIRSIRRSMKGAKQFLSGEMPGQIDLFDVGLDGGEYE